ncbi:MAG TPA: T9SS type A sorting domain-containing protein [Bacteroidia bacterium]|jgi:hypothetical protein
MKTKIILSGLLICINFIAKAQLVTIPDPHFVVWLNANVPSAMTGNQMDTGDMSIKTLSYANIAHDSISDLTGIEYFIGLKHLDCSYNMISTIADLPDSLEMLNCSRNNLDSLPLLPAYLTELICSSNPLDSLPVLPATLTRLTCINNNLAFLPMLPPSLEYLNCSGNLLTVLPVLPATLTELNCSSNFLANLPTLPASMTTLVCSGNQLGSLPALPVGLVHLDCNSNLLTALPVLPATLIILECYTNQLPVLPALPPVLEILSCGNNILPVLPSLPSSLLILKCYTNQLPALPVLPNLLNYLDCSSNVLPVLPVLPGSLTYLDCSHNPIPVLPALNSGLETLYCRYNQISMLPSLPSSLITLVCSFNTLSGLPVLNAGLQSLECASDNLITLPVLPSSLISLTCNSNFLTAFPPLPAGLTLLNCGYNQLLNIPALPGTLNLLDCSNNQLLSLPSLPGTLQSLHCNNNIIQCYPVFPQSILWISIYGNPGTCLPNYVPAMDSTILDYPLCIDGDFVNNPYGCDAAQGIIGFTYLDNNSNCALDSADQKYINIPMKLFSSTGALLSQTYTAVNGIYNFSEPFGNYTVAVDTTNVPFTPQCQAPGTDTLVSVIAGSPMVSNVNFDFGCKPGFDIGVRSVVPSGWVFPGQQHSVSITAGDMSQWYNMHCASGVAGQVKITVNGPVTFNGIMVGALNPVVNGNMFTYSINDFGSIINTQAFGLLFKTDTTAAAGSDICINVTVSTPLNGDNDSSNNVYDFCYQVINSHDPNMKEVYPGNVSPKYYGWLTYTIHFQNTGSAPAFNIRLSDTLDTDLDLSTFEVLNFSHANNATLDGNILTFRFPNIMLPDSTTDEAGSHGFIQYRARIKHYLPIGTLIENTAYIYFDYNEAIVTNTTTNEMIDPVSVEEKNTEPASELSLYPNPVESVISISTYGFSQGVVLEMLDITGRTMYSTKNISSKHQMDISGYAPGVYILKISDNNKSISKRFIKQ